MLLSIDHSPAGAEFTVVSAAEKLPEIVISPTYTVSVVNTLTAIYVAGLVICLLLTVFELIHMLLLISRAERTANGKVRIVEHSDISPFSFGHITIISRKDVGNESVLTHELAHISHHHTLDLVIAQITAILCWYCPAAWQMRRELKLVHEFQADDDVIRGGAGVSDYSTLLVTRAAGIKSYTFANSFNYNNLKQRIKMMQTPPSERRGGKLRVLYPLAAMALTLILLSLPIVSNAIGQISRTQLAEQGLDPKDGNNSVFVVYGIDLNSEDVKNGKFMTVTDFEASKITATDVDGVIFPNISAVFCTDKNVLSRLTPKVKKVMVDGKIMSVKDFSKFPASKISKVIVSGGAMKVITRDVHESEFFNTLEDAVNAENK